MGNRYRQIDIEERIEIARLQAEGRSIRQIAAIVDRAPSTVSRELKRNGSKAGYKPVYAQQQTRARRWSGSRLERDAGLRERVLLCLSWGWSPEQVSGRLALEVASGSSRTRASIGSSMLRWRAPKTTPGGTICHVGSQSVVGEGAGVAVLPLTSPTDVRSMSVRRQWQSARVRVIGRQT